MTREPPDWLLIRQITRIVHNAPGGGLHRLELAELLHMPGRGPSMREALGIAYRHRKIDFCRQYVVVAAVPLRPGAGRAPGPGRLGPPDGVVPGAPVRLDVVLAAARATAAGLTGGGCRPAFWRR